ncbi:MAG: tyrosine-type recombinase/integrase [Acidobacteria bacterium]|nr:tyrosine-type recombinase/integrase [Acidobacteriota bacterium]
MKRCLTAFLQFLALNRNASVHTVRAYKSDVSQLLDYTAAAADVKVGDLRPAHLDRAALRGFLGELHKRGRSRASAARKLAAARTFLRYLRREGLIDDDPGTLVSTPKRDVRMPAHLSEGEMSALLDAPAADAPLGRRDRAILELFYASGLRVSELAGLDIDDVNVSARMVRVLGKGRKERIVPFNTSAAKAIRAYLNDREPLVRGVRLPSSRHASTDALFVNYRGRRLTVRSLDRLVRRYVAASSARMGISPHASGEKQRQLITKPRRARGTRNQRRFRAPSLSLQSSRLLKEKPSSSCTFALDLTNCLRRYLSCRDAFRVRDTAGELPVRRFSSSRPDPF